MAAAGEKIPDLSSTDLPSCSTLMTPHSVPKLLIVSRDPAVVREVTAAARGFQVVSQREPAAPVAPTLAAHPTIVGVVAEYMSRQSGALELLQNVRAIRPALRRVVVSDFADLSLVMEGLHTGLLDGIVYRPIEAQELRTALRIPGTPTARPAPAGTTARNDSRPDPKRARVA
jgi:ActR/RegA family two-component response regulator